jgi:PEGA domain
MFLSPRTLRNTIVLAAFVAVSLPGFAKKGPLQVIDWPTSGGPVLRFTFDRFKSLPDMGSLHGYVMETTAQNLSSRVVALERFSVYLFDKKQERVGQDEISVSNLGPGETVKFETTVTASAEPVSLVLKEISPASRAISMTVNSAPQGAVLSLDGKTEGTTPRIISVGPGHHTLTFSKDGFNRGVFPLEISRNDVSGGTVSFDLSAASYDTIELRDGTVLNGDLVSISGMNIEVRIGGVIQDLNRNSVKRILLVQREQPRPNSLPAPAPNNQ